jgi:uridine monophosphate synthetase
MSEYSREELAAALFDIGAVRLGNFTLHSGVKSSIYIDMRLLVSHPAVLRSVAAAYEPILTGIDFDLLAAYPYAALPIGVAISLATDLPLIYPRKTAKSYGTGKLVEGEWQLGQRAVVIEDLITSGDSILQAIAALKATGLIVTDAVVLIDREQGGSRALAELGYTVHSVMTMSWLLDTLERLERISSRKRARVARELGLE